MNFIIHNLSKMPIIFLGDGLQMALMVAENLLVNHKVIGVTGGAVLDALNFFRKAWEFDGQQGIAFNLPHGSRRHLYDLEQI